MKYELHDIKKISIDNIDRHCCIIGANALRIICYMNDGNEIKFKSGAHHWEQEYETFQELAEDLYFEFYNKIEGHYRYKDIPVFLS